MFRHTPNSAFGRKPPLNPRPYDSTPWSSASDTNQHFELDPARAHYIA